MEQPNHAMTLQDAARMLKSRGIITGPRKIFRQLREVGLIERSRPCVSASIHDWLIVKVEHVDRKNFHRDYGRIFMTLDGLAEAEKRLEKYREPEPEPEPIRVPVKEISLGNGRECKLGF